MKIQFKKNENNDISVVEICEGVEKEFSYVEMIKSLIDGKSLETEKISDKFSEPEKKSIGSMIQLINNEIKEKNGI